MDTNKILFTNEPNDKMKLYKFLHQMKSNEVYVSKNIEATNSSQELAECIRENYDAIDVEEMKHFVLKCLTEKDTRRILLNYELKNLMVETKDIQLNEFKHTAQKVLNRYQSKAGGFDIADSHWEMHDSNSEKFEIYDNEIIFTNSIHESNLKNSETKDFLYHILRILNKISSMIKVSMHLKYYDRDKTYLLMLKCKEN